tara:strand:+ start:3812 stop:4255 length:444 start_codon:yes stop_codon:yes gene_type:complete
MANLNKVILIGRLGTHPEETILGESKVAEFSVATNDTWKDKNGEKQERTEWHTCKAWGRLADLAVNYLTKGSQVYLEGSIQTRSWEKDGSMHYKTEIKVFKIEFLDSKSSEESEAQSNSAMDSLSNARSKFESNERSDNAQADDIPF